MVNFFYKRRIINQLALINVLIFLCCYIQGCGVIIPGTRWSNMPYEGPQLEEGRYAKVVKRCAAINGFSKFKSCQTAFVDDKDNKILWSYLQNTIDSYLNVVAPISPWINKSREDGTDIITPSSPNNLYDLPYKMHILTISPIIILAVPSPNDPTNYCSPPIIQGCIPSRLTSGAFFYKSPINVLPGSFWFSPDLQIEATYIPDGATNYTIRLPDSYLKLIAENRIWRTKRLIER